MDSRVDDRAARCPLCGNVGIKPELVDHDLLYSVLEHRSSSAMLHNLEHRLRSLSMRAQDIKDILNSTELAGDELDKRIDHMLEMIIGARRIIDRNHSLLRWRGLGQDVMDDPLLKITESVVSFFHLHCVLLAFDTPAHLVKRIDFKKFIPLSYAAIQMIAIATRRSVHDKVYLRYFHVDEAIKGMSILPPDVLIDESGNPSWAFFRWSPPRWVAK